MKLVFENKLTEEYKQYALVDEYDWDHKFGPDLFISAEEAKEWGRNYLRKHPEQETLTLVDITDDENWEELDNIYNEDYHQKKMNKVVDDDVLSELADKYSDIYARIYNSISSKSIVISVHTTPMSLNDFRKYVKRLEQLLDDIDNL